MHAREVTSLEVLAGMRRNEEAATKSLLLSTEWHALDRQTAEQGAAQRGLGRCWLPNQGGIGSADLAVAALATLMGTGAAHAQCASLPHVPGAATVPVFEVSRGGLQEVDRLTV